MVKSKITADADDDLIKLGKRIKILRRKSGISQYQLGLLCGIDEPNLRKIENARTNPTFKSLHKIATALKVDMKTLMDFE